MSESKSIGVTLLGCGTVGGGVVSILLQQRDLLRRGTRPFAHPMVPQAHYLISLLRAGKRRTDIWAVDVKDKLPVVPVPLREPDPDVPLDLGIALRTIYERSLYNLSIDYHMPPPPPEFSSEDQVWLGERVVAQEGR